MAVAPDQDQPHGFALDGYTIERELGRGGMATVYLAHDAKHDRAVAIKVLHGELAASLGPERFRREIAIAAKLQHPHILTVLDSGQTATGKLWFTMPHVDGESLRDRLRRQRQLPVADALRITREVALALDYAHRHNIIHRDIKPENILLVDGQAMIADFGIARALESSASPAGATVTETGIAIGTPAYMSPEQAAGERSLDGRTDVYALGAVLYEMLTGEPPFTGPTAQAIAAKMMSSDPPSVRRTRPTVPVAVDLAVHKALAPVPADRFETAAEFAKALDVTGATMAAVGPPVRGTSRLIRYVAGLAVALLVVGGSLFAWRLLERTRVEAGPVRLAVLPFDNLGDSVDAYFADGMTDAVRAKLTAIPGLEVIAPASSAQYRKTTKTPQQIGAELGVRYLLVGKVRWAKSPGTSGRVEVSPALVEVSTAADKWEQPFDAPLTDVFQVQADIAGKVAQQLQVTLSSTTRETLDERPTTNLDAYDAYLRGRETERGGAGAANLHRAATWYQEAVGRDSTFALAWAALASALANMYFIGVPTPADAEATRVAAARALALAPDLPEAHAAQATYYGLVLGDRVRALAELEAGLRLSPRNALLLRLAGAQERALGRWDEGIALTKQAARLDPRDGPTAVSLGAGFLFLRRYAEARTALDHAIALAPQNLRAIELRAEVELAEGDLDSARAIIRGVSPTVDAVALTAYLAEYNDLGWVLDSAQERLLRTLPPSSFDNNRAAWGTVMAQAYAFRGDQMRTRAYADSARQAFEAEIRAAPANPLLRALHGLVLAYLGRRDEAVAEGERSVALQPMSADQVSGPFNQHQLVRIHIILGEPEKALDKLEPLLKVPYWLSPGWLRIDPNFAPLRGNPRFERLIAQPATGPKPAS